MVRKTKAADVDDDEVGSGKTLSINQLNRLEAIIDERGNSTVHAAGAQLVVDDDVIKSKLLEKAGFTQSEETLSMKQREAEQKLRALNVGKDPLLEELNLQRGRLDATIEAEIEQMKMSARAKTDQIDAEFRKSAMELRKSKADRMKEIDEVIEHQKREIVGRLAPGLQEEIDNIRKTLPLVMEYTRQIGPDVDRLARDARLTKEKLQLLIADATSRAKTEILSCSTIAEAQDVINKCIPTVAAVIMAANSDNGMDSLLRKIAPDYDMLALSAPRYDAPQLMTRGDTVEEEIVASFFGKTEKKEDVAPVALPLSA